MDDLSAVQRAAWKELVARWNNDADALRELPRAAVLRLTKDEDAVGWRAALPPDYLGEDRQLDIILPSGFPNVPPQFWIQPNAFLLWPHAERNGKLCLWVEGEAPVWDSPTSQIADAVEQFRRVFALVAAGSDQAAREREFAREWMSYWRIASKTGSRLSATGLLISRPDHPAARLHSAQIRIAVRSPGDGASRELTVLAASHDRPALNRWIQNTAVPCDDEDDGYALFIRLREAPSQPGAPDSIESLRAFINDWGEDAATAQRVLEELFALDDSRAIWIVFEHDERALEGLYLSPKMGRKKNGGKRRKRAALPNKRPRIGTNFSVMDVQRADTGWVHGRDFDSNVHTLSGCHVVLVGVGSLGGFVAENLALSGVGRLTLIDPGTLEMANVGRHALGALCVGRAKAEALRDRLCADYPHLCIEAIDELVEKDDARIRAALSEADIVVSTTALPSTEQFLLDAQHNSMLKALQLAWSEPFALAGHSAIALDASIGLSGLFDSGECLRAAIEWNTDTESLLPGCGASHIPGAGNRVRLIASWVAEHTIDTLTSPAARSQHRTWVSDSETIANHGGRRLRPTGNGGAAVLVDEMLPVPISRGPAVAI